ncbi:hypothetical protein HK102_014112 [Quaeritorhiza haematococci]|nr:hypothetical protein HK102_014112 [Quaeritorhiza haematococci]
MIRVKHIAFLLVAVAIAIFLVSSHTPHGNQVSASTFEKRTDGPSRENPDSIKKHAFDVVDQNREQIERLIRAAGGVGDNTEQVVESVGQKVIEIFTHFKEDPKILAQQLTSKINQAKNALDRVGIKLPSLPQAANANGVANNNGLVKRWEPLIPEPLQPIIAVTIVAMVVAYYAVITILSLPIVVASSMVLFASCMMDRIRGFFMLPKKKDSFCRQAFGDMFDNDVAHF